MNYQVIEDGEGQENIVLTFENGNMKSFPATNSNPEFIAFLQELEKENDPYFTAWVDEGNDPDEFWNGALDG